MWPSSETSYTVITSIAWKLLVRATAISTIMIQNVCPLSTIISTHARMWPPFLPEFYKHGPSSSGIAMDLRSPWCNDYAAALQNIQLSLCRCSRRATPRSFLFRDVLWVNSKGVNDNDNSARCAMHHRYSSLCFCMLLCVSRRHSHTDGDSRFCGVIVIFPANFTTAFRVRVNSLIWNPSHIKYNLV